MNRRHDSQLLIQAPELRHLTVLVESLGASEQDLLVECGTDGFDYDRSPTQLAAFELIADIRRLYSTISRYRRRRIRSLRPPQRADEIF
jgi:hypothetical protein